MSQNNLFEKKSILERTKGLLTLAIFTIIVAAISLVVMDILVFPLTVFAINFTKIYTFLIKNIGFIVLILFVLFLIGRKIYLKKKNGLTEEEIGKYILHRLLYYFSVFLVIVILTAIIILFLYLILNNNYYFIYKFTN